MGTQQYSHCPKVLALAFNWPGDASDEFEHIKMFSSNSSSFRTTSLTYNGFQVLHLYWSYKIAEVAMQFIVKGTVSCCFSCCFFV